VPTLLQVCRSRSFMKTCQAGRDSRRRTFGRVVGVQSSPSVAGRIFDDGKLLATIRNENRSLSYSVLREIHEWSTRYRLAPTLLPNAAIVLDEDHASGIEGGRFTLATPSRRSVRDAAPPLFQHRQGYRADTHQTGRARCHFVSAAKGL
jgi:hypothetical protein